MKGSDPRLAVVDAARDSEASELPFGKRWNHETVTLKPEHLEALRQGRLVAVDVQAEYVVYLKLDVAPKELGNGN
ncbi:MAG TPA: hypothetical protein VMX35_13450 [Acidobacteriota bacterium]|nr:hypothetical protein [Acidobacteriota bacterium]